MPRIDPDMVPSTIEAAVDHIVDRLRPLEVEAITTGNVEPCQMHDSFGQHIRNQWSLWHDDSPMKRDAIFKYRIAHADDISALILDWVFAKVKGLPFDPKKNCERFHAHWKKQGLTSLQAGESTAKEDK